MSLLCICKAKAMVTPKIDVTVEKNNTIKVLAQNTTGSKLSCDWVVTYFESGLKFKRNLGELFIASNSNAEVVIKNDPYTKIKDIRTKVECE